jgi:hypothetical protein
MTSSQALLASILLAMVTQTQPLQAEPLSLPGGSYELTARLELPHLERWGVDKTTIICLPDSRGEMLTSELPRPATRLLPIRPILVAGDARNPAKTAISASPVG